MSDKLRDYVKQLQTGALSQVKLEEVIRALVESDVAVLDAQNEIRHWQAAFGKVQLELKAVLAVVMSRYKLARFIVTAGEVARIPTDVDLHVGDPEPKVRVYEFKPKAEGKQKRSMIATAVDKAMH